MADLTESVNYLLQSINSHWHFKLGINKWQVGITEVN